MTWASDGAAGREGFAGQPRGSVEGSPAGCESVYEISGYRANRAVGAEIYEL